MRFELVRVRPRVLSERDALVDSLRVGNYGPQAVDQGSNT